MNVAKLYHIIVVLLIVESFTQIDIHDICLRKKINGLNMVIFFAATLLPFLSFYIDVQPLFVFYISYLLLCIIQQIFLNTCKKRLTDYARVRFLLFSSLHLICVGIVSSLAAFTVREVIYNKFIMLSCACVAVLLTIIVKLALQILNENIILIIPKKNKKYFRFFYIFLHSHIAFVLIQSVLCTIPAGLENASIFLAYSNSIALVMAGIYIFNISKILRTEHAQISSSVLQSNIYQTDIRLYELRKNTNFDELTGAYSRIYIVKYANELLEKKALFSLVYIDLNDIKKINDTYGHQKGDQYLCKFVQIMKSSLGENDVLARYGGDEFVIVMPELNHKEANDIIQDIRIKMKNNQRQISFSMGIADSTEEKQIDALITTADRRMYREKMEKRRIMA